MFECLTSLLLFLYLTEVDAVQRFFTFAKKMVFPACFLIIVFAFFVHGSPFLVMHRFFPLALHGNFSIFPLYFLIFPAFHI